VTGKLIGNPEPRLLTEPLRALNRKTSRGYEVADFARHVLNEPLLPWQENLAVRALEVNPDGTYRFRTVLCLVARQSGKTHFLRTLTLWRLYLDRVRLVLGVAQNVSLAREVWTSCLDSIRATPDLAVELDKVRHVNGDEQFVLSSGARYKLSAANRSAGRGLSVDQLNLDEIREQRNWDAWSALSKTTMARPFAQTWAISNAGDNGSVVLNSLRESALAGRDDSLGIFEWSAEEGCELDDPRAWAQANPGLGHTVSAQAIRSALGTDPPEQFRTEVLCQRVDTLDTAIDFGAWRDCADASGSLASVRSRVVVCLDVAPDERHASLVGAAVLPDGRVRVEVLSDWKSVKDARAEIRPLVEAIRPAAISFFPSGPAAALAADLGALEAVQLTGGAVQQSCMEFASLVSGRQIVHPDDQLLNAHIAGASRLHSGDAWRFTRKGPVGHVDCLYAAAGAVHVARTLPVPVRRPEPMVV
jgi:hypothetical protein